MSLKRRGSNSERELLKKLWNSGFACVRIAGSGSSSFPTPDLLAGKNGKILAIEVKSTKKDQIHLREMQLEELEIFSKTFGAEAYVAVKFIGNGWYIIPLEEAKKKITIKLKEVKDYGIPLKDFISKFK